MADDVMQALQDFAARQRMQAVDQQASGVPTMQQRLAASAGAAGHALNPSMPQAQFSGYPAAGGAGRPMNPMQLQQLLMLLKQRQMQAPPQATMASMPEPGMPVQQ